MNGLKPKLIAAERIQAILDYWFTPTWDRNSKTPPSLYPAWWGMKYDTESQKMLPMIKEEHEKIDQDIKDQFLEDLKLSEIREESGYFNNWRFDKQGRLALVILQDQMARNIFRKQAEAFSFEKNVLEIVLEVIKDNREDKSYKFYERMFLYLPLEHSENIAHQDLCYEMFEELSKDFVDFPDLKKAAEGLMKFSEEHRSIVKRFGRFPHRNETLGREPTQEEVNYLNKGGSRFGQ